MYIRSHRPVDRKMVINGLNSGANVYMADFEDSTSPTWSNLTEGQRNLRDATRGKITYTNKQTGRVYALKEKTAVLFVRPRGWHLDEAHVTVNGRVASGSLFDFALYFYHNVHCLLQKGSRPYFYLPKLEHYLEARLWNDVFKAARSYFGVPYGTIRATVALLSYTSHAPPNNISKLLICHFLRHWMLWSFFVSRLAVRNLME
jgi:malate synthase